MKCETCPVYMECESARGVAIRACDDETRREIKDKIHGICPIEEVLYVTFQAMVINVKREIDERK